MNIPAFSRTFPPFLGDFSVSAPFRVDIEEDNAQYRIHADLPGAAKENVSVRVENNVLTITANIAPRGDKTLRAERISGELSRAFRLSRKVDAENIGAAMENGVLTVSLPKATDESARTIEIH